MILMNETEFVAHALTDYLSVSVDQSLITALHQSLGAGEAESAIGFALGVAASQGIPLSDFMREKILSLLVSTSDKNWFAEELRTIPLVELAS